MNGFSLSLLDLKRTVEEKLNWSDRSQKSAQDGRGKITEDRDEDDVTFARRVTAEQGK